MKKKLYTIERRLNEETPFEPVRFFENVKLRIAYGGWVMLTYGPCKADGAEYRVTVCDRDGSNKHSLWSWPLTLGDECGGKLPS
jgi:hypothetical protein